MSSIRGTRFVVPLILLIYLSVNSESLTKTPVIDVQKSSYQLGSGKLILRGKNYLNGASVDLKSGTKQVHHGPVLFKNSELLIVKGVIESELKIEKGLTVRVINPDLAASATVRLRLNAADQRLLTVSDVEQILAQAAVQAQASGLNAFIAVTDREGNVLGMFEMNGAPDTTAIPGVGLAGDPQLKNVPSNLAAISKAGTGAFLSSQGMGFTTRTASFIVQEHFPPGIDFTSGGPLYGVQFSQLAICTDIKKPGLPLGLSADPGGLPIYKNKLLVGGVGVEGDGVYGFDADPRDDDQPVEETVAFAATRGYETPAAIQASEIIVNGLRFPFANVSMPPLLPVPPLDDIDNGVLGNVVGNIQDTPPSSFHPVVVDGVPGKVDDRFSPFRESPSTSSNKLTAADVQTILVQGAKQASITRAAIRRPLGSPAEVNLAVVDAEGNVLGIFSTPDAPVFGFDVCVQKARTAAFFSRPNAAEELRTVEGGKFARYVDAANRDGLRLDGTVAFSDRAVGFLHRPFFPDGINGSEAGPFSTPEIVFSPFNDGLQLDLLITVIKKALLQGELSDACTAIPGVQNGLQIFPGSVPLYKNGELVGAIGISGDGVDQDDLIAAMGSTGFDAPSALRSDRVFVRGVRLPYVKFPRHPNL